MPNIGWINSKPVPLDYLCRLPLERMLVNHPCDKNAGKRPEKNNQITNRRVLMDARNSVQRFTGKYDVSGTFFLYHTLYQYVSLWLISL